MLNLRFTDKVQKKLKCSFLKNEVVPELNPSPFLDWTVNLFTANRYQYFIFTNSTSLLSVFAYTKGVSDNRLYETFLSSLESYHKEIGLELVFRNIIAKASPITLSKTLPDRKLTGSMVNLVKGAILQIEIKDRSLFELPLLINETPLKMLNYSNPILVYRGIGRS